MSRRNDPNAAWPHPADCLCGNCDIAPGAPKRKTPAEARARDLRQLSTSLTFEMQRLTGAFPALLRAVADDVDHLSEGVQAGVACIVRRGERVLLGRRKGSHGEGTWAFPGGRMERGETVFGCASRELKEETGLDRPEKAFSKLTYTNDVFVRDGKHFITLYVEVHCFIGKPVVMEPEKCEEWEWFREPPSPLFLPVQNLIASGFKIWRNKR